MYHPTIQDLIDGNAKILSEAAKEIGCSARTLRDWVRKGEVVGSDWNNRFSFFHNDEIARLKSRWENRSRAKHDYFVYFLRCPDSGVVRYVGMSSNLKARIRGHMKPCDSTNPKKVAWVESLLDAGKSAVLDSVLGPFKLEVAKRVEDRLIEKHMKTYDRNVNGDLRYAAHFPELQSHDDSDDHLCSSGHAPVADFAGKVNTALQSVQEVV